MASSNQRFSTTQPALKTAVVTQLERLLASRVFEAAHRLRELLRFIVEETLEGRGDDLKEYLLGVSVLRKKDTFEPKTDPIVRVQMGRLRQHLDKYYATEGRDDTIIIDIPKGGYRPVFRGAVSGGVLAAPAIGEDRLMVGRQIELHELNSAFSLAANGRGRWLCLAGEPGIGKTTVVETYLRELAVSGMNCYVGRGRCSQRLAGTEAYLPILEVLESLLRNGETSRLMSAVAPTWYVQVAPLTEDPLAERILAQSRMGSQERLKRELSKFLEELARRQPVVLFLDDLHWADISTIDILAYVGTRCATQRILVVCAYRPEELLSANHPFLRVKLELQGHGICREVLMRFLTHADVDAYLALRFPEHLFPPELAEEIQGKTEGNPLFMTDLVQFLCVRSVLVQRFGQWIMAGQLSQLGRELPESVRSMIHKKIDQLSHLDRRLLSAAAVQGEEFESAVVARALELPPADVESRLERLDQTHGLVFLIGDRELPDSTLTLRYRFVHVLYQNSLQNALPATRRATLSISVAEAMLQSYGEKTNEVASQLAFLFEAGRDFRRASDFFLIAALHAAQMYAAQEAIALARRAIANAEKLRGRDRHSRVVAAALHSGEQYTSLTRFSEGIADFELAERSAEEMEDPERRVSAIYRKAVALFMAKRLPEVKEQGMRAAQLAQTADSPLVTATCDAIQAMERSCIGDVEGGLEQFDRAIPVLKRDGLTRQALVAVCIRGSLHSLRLEHDEAHQDLQWVHESASRLGVSFDTMASLFHGARARGNEGKLSDAWSMLEEARQLSDLLGDDRFWGPRIANTRGWILAELLDVESALVLDTEAVRLCHASGGNDFDAECNSCINVGRDYLSLGEPETAWQHFQQATALYERDVWFRWIYYPRLQAELARYWIAVGEVSAALDCAILSLQHAQKTLNRKRMAWAYKLLGDVAALSDQPMSARVEFTRALNILEHHRCPTIEWQILKADADAAGLLHDTNSRSERLGRARELVRSLADDIREDSLRTRFLRTKPVRDLFG